MYYCGMDQSLSVCQVMECTTVGWITVTLSLSGDGMHYCGMDQSLSVCLSGDGMHYCGMDQSLSVCQVMECTTVGWISHSQSVR